MKIVNCIPPKCALANDRLVVRTSCPFRARFGAAATLASGGVFCIIGSIWFALRLPTIRALVRPIYRELGILPELAIGVQQASALQTPPEN